MFDVFLFQVLIESQSENIKVRFPITVIPLTDKLFVSPWLQSLCFTSPVSLGTMSGCFIHTEAYLRSTTCLAHFLTFMKIWS